MKIKLISKENLKKIIAADPKQRIYTTTKYYRPIIKTFYLKRIEIGLKMLDNKKHEKLLDLGFGGGIILPELSKHAQLIEGVDIHKNIDLVKKIVAEEGLENIHLQFGNATSLPFSNESFDCVWCLSLLEFVDQPEKVISEIKRVAQKNATIIIGLPMENKITTLAYKLTGFDACSEHKNNHRQILNLLKQHFKITVLKKIPDWLPLNYSLYCVLKIA